MLTVHLSFPPRSTILQESKALLKSQTVSDQSVAEALCAIMLLEDSSPRQALADFLLARKLAIQQRLNQPHHGQYHCAASFLNPFTSSPSCRNRSGWVSPVKLTGGDTAMAWHCGDGADSAWCSTQMP